MNTIVDEAVALASAICKELNNPVSRGVETVLCPPFVSLVSVRKALQGSGLKLGAQNTYFESRGAFTGEVSPDMLLGLCEYVIIGHSERRHILKEDDGLINLKMKAVTESGLKPILCVGETLDQRRDDQAESVVRRQLETGLKGVERVENLVVAYEPVWAIGTGESASPEAVIDITGGAIADGLVKLYGEKAAAEIPVLYGGSVNPENVAGFLQESSIHGTLVGGASLKSQQFAQIVRLTAEIKAGS